MLFVVGVQLIGMGLLAELLVRTYHESQSKPVYLIAEEVNAPVEVAAGAADDLARSAPRLNAVDSGFLVILDSHLDPRLPALSGISRPAGRGPALSVLPGFVLGP